MTRPRKLFDVLLFSLLAAFIVTLPGLGQCYGLPAPDEGEERIFAQSACAGVSNGPPNPTVFTIDEPRTITKMGTYHYGSGQSPGTIGLRDEQGKTYGPWQAEGKPGQGGVPNAYWIVELTPALDLPAGTYTIIDSSPSTWSYTYESNDCGLASVVGLKGGSDGGLQLAGAWKMYGHQEGFNDWKGDLNLNNDGTLEWTEIEGANVGAHRVGTWQFDGTVLTLNWVSPGGGQTNWVSRSVAKNSISSGTYTVEWAPGGTWSAIRSTEGF